MAFSLSQTIEYPSNTSANSGKRDVSPTVTDGKERRYPDIQNILRTISPCVGPCHRERIAKELHLVFKTQNVLVEHLRTMSFRNFPMDVPIIAWREEHDVDVLAFCRVSDTDQPCSWFMHLGFGAALRNLGNWDRTSIRWMVSDLAHLQELAARAEHIFGLVEFSDEGLSRFCHENCKSSREKYFRYSR